MLTEYALNVYNQLDEKFKPLSNKYFEKWKAEFGDEPNTINAQVFEKAFYFSHIKVKEVEYIENKYYDAGYGDLPMLVASYPHDDAWVSIPR